MPSFGSAPGGGRGWVSGVMDDTLTHPLSSSASTYPARAGAITVLGPSPKTVTRVSVEAGRNCERQLHRGEGTAALT